MFLAKKLLSALILPPTGFVLLALAGLALALSTEGKRRRIGGVLCAGSLLLLLALAIPAVARYLPIERITTPISREALAQAQAIVILGGGIYANAPEFGEDTLAGSGLERVHYGARLAQESRLPVLVTGGAPYGGTPEALVMKRVLETEFRVPTRWVEDASRDTAENAKLSAALLKREGITRIALLSHSTHLPRAVPMFEREGLTVFAAPTILPRNGPRELEFSDFLPNAGTLSRSADSLYESLGRLASFFSQLFSR